MRKVLSVLLCVVILAAFPAAGRAEGFDLDALEDQAFAVSMACWLSGFESGKLTDLILWDACGWHAARQERITGQPLMRESEVRDFLMSIGGKWPMTLPPSWEEYGIVNRIIGAGSSVNYDFSQNKLFFGEMIGIDTEVSTVMTSENSTATTITVHRGENTVDYVFRITFAENTAPASRYPYQVVQVEKGAVPAKMDERLNFTWELLMEQNSLSNILSMVDNVRIFNPVYTPEDSIWIFRKNGHIAILADWSGYTSGTYGFYTFDTYAFEDGRTRASIGYVSYDPLEELYDETYITDYLKGIVEFRFLREEDDLIWMDAVFPDGEAEQVAVDKGTLFLREISFTYDADYPASVTSFEYNAVMPEFPFMAGWDRDLRTVTAIWENYDETIQDLTYRTENLQIPMDWEYLPYEVRWGDYTAYLNPRYTGSYTYPGDIYNYTVYFTAVKG